MNFLRHKRLFWNVLTATVLGLGIVVASCFQDFSGGTWGEHLVDTEEVPGTSSDQLEISVLNPAVPTGAPMLVNFQPLIIEEIALMIEPKLLSPIVQNAGEGRFKFAKVLFRRIISPNAP